MRQELVSIPTATQLRNRQTIETLTIERDFWMKRAEELYAQLVNVFDQAKDNGKVDLYQNGMTVKLVKAPEVPNGDRGSAA